MKTGKIETAVSDPELIRRYAVEAGQTFAADLNGRSVPMRIERVIDGLAICKSLDLKHTGRWRTDAIARALAEQRGQETCSYCGGNHWRPDCPEIRQQVTGL